jgi:lipoate---protein ligase
VNERGVNGWQVMVNPIRLLDYGIVPYLRSQAIYHAVADSMSSDAPDTILLLAPDRPHFCVGFHQDPRQELDLEFCRTHNYPVLRRRVGGGTTYLDSNQLYYQFVFHYRRAPAVVDALYKFALAAPVETLRALGLDAELRGTNEIVANGKRIAGTGAGRLGEASVVVGNFLFDFDYGTMAGAWQVPSETYRRLALEGLQQYVTTLRRELANPPGIESVKTLLIEKIAETLGRSIEQGIPTPREEELAHRAEEELTSQERLFEVEGAPRRGLKIADGVWMHYATCYLLIGGSEGGLSVSARVRGQTIDAIAIEPQGGFSGRIWEVVASALVGLPMEYEAVKAPIERLQRAGLIPEEINLEPLVKTIVKLGV